VQPGWLESLIETATSEKRYGIVGSIGCDWDDLSKTINRGAWDIIGGKVIQDFGNPHINDRVQQHPYVGLFCALIKQEVVETIGLLDERFFMWCSDADYCLRAFLASYQAVTDPHCRVRHREGSGDSKYADPNKKTPGYDVERFVKKYCGGDANFIFTKFPLVHHPDNMPVVISARVGVDFLTDQGEKIPFEALPFIRTAHAERGQRKKIIIAQSLPVPAGNGGIAR